LSRPLFDGFLFFAGSLVIFITVQRWLYRELQAIFLLITRQANTALGIFSLLLFPGVFLHELSHFVMAKILLVRTGRFSLIPKALANGKIRMGYVETAATDPIRDTLIGAAPLISGVAVVTILGMKPLGILPLTELLFSGSWGNFWPEVMQLPARPDFWLWFYLAFAVSSTMLPSSADRRAWWSIGLFVLLAFALAIIPGTSAWMLENLAPLVTRGLRALAVVFAASGLIHLVLVLPAILIRIVISRMTGLRVV